MSAARARRRGWIRSRIALVWLPAVLLVIAPARAQDARAAAEALFKEGRAAMRAKDYAAACPKFAESQRLDPAPGTLLNLATCEEKLGKLASAWQRLEEVLQVLEARDSRRKAVQQQAAKLDSRVPRLVLITAPGGPSTVTVSVDGIALGAASLGVPLPVDPGDHAVVAEAPEHEPRRYDVTLAEGEKKELAVEPGPALPPPAPVAAPAPPPPSPRASPSEKGGAPTLAWIVGGIGVAGLVTSAVGAVMVLDRDGVVERECDADRRCSREGLDAASAGRTWSTVATISFAVGVAGLGTSAWLFLSAPSRGPEESALAGVRGRF